MALREVLYTALTEVKRQTTCAHSTTPSSRVRDSLILTLLGTPSWWCSTVSPHPWSRHCSPRHSSPITPSETWGSTALGHKYTLFLHYWWKTKAVCLTDLLSLRAEVEKTHQLSDLALISLFRGTERRFDRWASTNRWLGAKRGKTTKEREKITPSLQIYCFCWLFFPT